LLIMAAFVAVAAVVSGRYDNPALFSGVGAYLVLSVVLRYTVTREHRNGVRLMRAGRFEDAVPAFQRSVAFFERHPRIDRLRAFTALSASSMTYREMAMCNIAFALAQLRRGEAAKNAYERVLAEYPDNGMARAALNIILGTESRLSAP
jgi:hypothetical protein